jgi:hypothetical protein
MTFKSQKPANLFEESMRERATDQSQMFDEQYRMSINGSQIDENEQEYQEQNYNDRDEEQEPAPQSSVPVIADHRQRANNSLGHANLVVTERLEEDNFANRINDTQVMTQQREGSKLSSEQTQPTLVSGPSPFLNDALSLKTHDFFDLGQT